MSLTGLLQVSPTEFNQQTGDQNGNEKECQREDADEGDEVLMVVFRTDHVIVVGSSKGDDFHDHAGLTRHFQMQLIILVGLQIVDENLAEGILVREESIEMGFTGIARRNNLEGTRVQRAGSMPSMDLPRFRRRGSNTD